MMIQNLSQKTNTKFWSKFRRNIEDLSNNGFNFEKKPNSVTIDWQREFDTVWKKDELSIRYFAKIVYTQGIIE